MARPYFDLKVLVGKRSFASISAWLLGFVVPVMAQNTIVAGEAKAPVTHQGNAFLETLFPILNNISLVALIGVVVFGLIWLLQRKKTEAGATADGESSAEAKPAEAETASAPEAEQTAETVSEGSQSTESKSAENSEKLDDTQAEKSV